MNLAVGELLPMPPPKWRSVGGGYVHPDDDGVCAQQICPGCWALLFDGEEYTPTMGFVSRRKDLNYRVGRCVGCGRRHTLTLELMCRACSVDLIDMRRGYERGAEAAAHVDHVWCITKRLRAMPLAQAVAVMYRFIPTGETR